VPCAQECTHSGRHTAGSAEPIALFRQAIAHGASIDKEELCTTNSRIGLSHRLALSSPRLDKSTDHAIMEPVPVTWPQLRVAGGIAPVDVVTHLDERTLASGGRAQLDADDILRVWDGGDLFVAKFAGDRIVQIREPGHDSGRWTVLLVDS
jgi:hypothetical protein